MKKKILSLIIFSCFSSFGQLNHPNGYFTMYPYSSSYDDGTYAKLFYDGNNRRIQFWNSDNNSYTGINIGKIYAGGDVGIGTGDPKEALDVVGSARIVGRNLHEKNLSYMNNSNSLLVGWNRSGGHGETSFLTNRGAGSIGGFEFRDIDNSGTERVILTMRGEGNVGIGYNNPNAQLVVGNAFGASISGSSGGNAVFGTNIAIHNGGSNHNQIFTPHSHSGNYGYSGIHARGGTLKFYTAAQNTTSNTIITPETRMYISPIGNVGIGTTTPQSKLSVDGQIRATEVKVLANVNDVPDYVFESNYDLITLQEVKEYISKNKHLPEIPSSKEIGENGLDLGDMNIRLLKKIEELTLYQIQLMEEMKEMRKELECLKN